MFVQFALVTFKMGQKGQKIKVDKTPNFYNLREVANVNS